MQKLWLINNWGLGEYFRLFLSVRCKVYRMWDVRCIVCGMIFGLFSCFVVCLLSRCQYLVEGVVLLCVDTFFLCYWRACGLLFCQFLCFVGVDGEYRECGGFLVCLYFLCEYQKYSCFRFWVEFRMGFFCFFSVGFGVV